MLMFDERMCSTKFEYSSFSVSGDVTSQSYPSNKLNELSDLDI